jgi:hypothetical protein
MHSGLVKKHYRISHPISPTCGPPHPLFKSKSPLAFIHNYRRIHASPAIASARTELPPSVLAAPCSAALPPTSWNGAPGFPLPPSPALPPAADVVIAVAGVVAGFEALLPVGCGGCGLLPFAGLVTTGAGREGFVGAAPHMETLVTPSRVAVGDGTSLVSQLVVGAGGGCGGAIEGVVGCACGVASEVGVVMETSTLWLVMTSGMLMGGCGGGADFGGGQMASTMPPWRIAPSSELGGAGASEQALMTLPARACRAASHCSEQPW